MDNSPPPKHLTINTADCCVRKRLKCPLPWLAQISAQSGWRWQCEICDYFTRYMAKAEKYENLHFGPSLTDIDVNDDDVDDDDDDDGWVVDGVAIQHRQPPPAAPAAPATPAATTPTVTSSDGDDDDLLECRDDDDVAVGELLPALVVREGGDCADKMVKLTGKTEFSSNQLYPNVEWLSYIVPQEHDLGVLTAYTLLFYTFLFRASITSHVEGLHNVTHVKKLLSLKDFGTQFLGCLLPGWLKLIFDPNFGWKSFTTAVLDSLVRKSKTVFRQYDDERGCVYMKATHPQKKSWIPFLNMCLENLTHPSVICFCQRVLVTLSSMLDGPVC